MRADLVEVGDVLVGDGTSAQSLKVSKILTRERNGAYAPLTVDGTLLVNGIAVSNYVAVKANSSEYFEIEGWRLPITEAAAEHAFVSPLRLTCMGVTSQVCDWRNTDGVHVWLGAGQQLIKTMESQRFLVQLVMMVLTLTTLAPFVLVELAFGATYGPIMMMIGIVLVHLVARNSNLSLVGCVVNKKKI